MGTGQSWRTPFIGPLKQLRLLTVEQQPCRGGSLAPGLYRSPLDTHLEFSGASQPESGSMDRGLLPIPREESERGPLPKPNQSFEKRSGSMCGGEQRKWVFPIHPTLENSMTTLGNCWPGSEQKECGLFCTMGPLPWEAASCSLWALRPPTARLLPAVSGFSLRSPFKLAS